MTGPLSLLLTAEWGFPPESEQPDFPSRVDSQQNSGIFFSISQSLEASTLFHIELFSLSGDPIHWSPMKWLVDLTLSTENGSWLKVLTLQIALTCWPWMPFSRGRFGQMSLLVLPLTTLAPNSPTFMQDGSLGVRGPALEWWWGGGGFCFHLCLWLHRKPELSVPVAPFPHSFPLDYSNLIQA